ncbi:hypothetical protein IFR04_005055 [Cadophora malorum]|uniref:Mid2 domain-containing protein n=1 Tax=Cadophora malorum TaxID=108018 RepID=A0A8H7TM64_9HELO|nr:hypothetical protein IFR04_005055 [Cadophora malorum]
MNSIFLLSLLLYVLYPIVTAQGPVASDISPSTTAATTISTISLTPEMSASAVSSLYQTLATSVPSQPGDGPAAGDAGSSPGSGDSAAGAAGADHGSIAISRGGIIAIIVVAVSVCILGAVSAVLFYLAKKRSWQVRESIRRSARRVATALTPRRSTFPKDVHSRSNRGLTKIDEVPTPKRAKAADVEKGHPKLMSFEMAEPPSKESKWARKFGR